MKKKKFALAIHHLNIAYLIGDEPSYHRQVRESIVPLLDLLSRHPDWCFTIEMSGFSVAFIANHHPAVLERIKRLIGLKQIEFVSCTYSPQIWISFPKTDMIKSIELNLELLKKYDITPTRIFFSQENFSGKGMAELKQWFDIAVVKDDYYYYLHDVPETIPPYYQLGDMKLLVGWGHILEGAALQLNDGSDLSGTEHRIKDQHAQVLQNALQKNANHGKLTGYRGQCNGIEWQWYHIGSSERFAKVENRPDYISSCRFNAEWHFFLEKTLLQYEKDGYQLSSIEAFVEEISNSSFTPEPCGNLLDGAWSMTLSRGVHVWTGYNSYPGEDDLLVRNHNWFSRARLVGLESILAKTPQLRTPAIESKIQQAWKHQLHAEVSDATGWYPYHVEIQYSIDESEKVLNIVSDVMNYLKLGNTSGSWMIDSGTGEVHVPTQQSNNKIEPSCLYTAAPSLFGASGTLAYYQTGPNTQLLVADFTPNENSSGIRFLLETDHLIFSPALMDHQTVRYALNSFNPDIVCLPLPNGLLCVKENIFVIKHNETMNIAAIVDCKNKTINFEIGNPKQKPTHWVLTLFQGTEEKALEQASSINLFPVVYL